MAYRKGTNGFVCCETCGMPGHAKENCPLKEHYHLQAQRQLASGSRDPEILREVYGERRARREPQQC